MDRVRVCMLIRVAATHCFIANLNLVLYSWNCPVNKSKNLWSWCSNNPRPPKKTNKTAKMSSQCLSYSSQQNFHTFITTSFLLLCRISSCENAFPAENLFFIESIWKCHLHWKSGPNFCAHSPQISSVHVWKWHMCEGVIPQGDVQTEESKLSNEKILGPITSVLGDIKRWKDGIYMSRHLIKDTHFRPHLWFLTVNSSRSFPRPRLLTVDVRRQTGNDFQVERGEKWQRLKLENWRTFLECFLCDAANVSFHFSQTRLLHLRARDVREKSRFPCSPGASSLLVFLSS